MDSVTPEDAIKIAAIRRDTHVCVLDAQQQMRTFLADTLEELGFVTCECAHLAELPAVLASRLPDIVLIGSSAGGIEACEIMELLAADDFDGHVLVLGSRVSPMVAAVRELGERLGLNMLPLLATPFSREDVRDRIAALVPSELAPIYPANANEALAAVPIDLLYQPKIDTRTLALSGAEALMRPVHSRPAHVSPDDARCLEPIPELVIGQAIADWRYFAARYGHFEIAINLPIAFVQDPEAIKKLCQQIPEQSAFGGLIVEIDAAEAVRNLRPVKEVARVLRDRPVAFSIDNVAMEWPLLSELDEFPFVEIKVAPQLVGGCADNRRKQTMCRRIIDLADAVGARSVAEGVESRSDLVAVLDMGFNLAQGALLARPMSAKSFTRTVLGRRTPWPLV
jgi:EAL domain-containing protein (putative c-di-GMP-specific phosphodiesterase class I)